MNDAVYKFRRYEDASLSYTGIEKHSYDARVGLFDTSLTREDFAEMARQDTLLDETGRMIRTTGAVKTSLPLQTLVRSNSPRSPEQLLKLKGLKPRAMMHLSALPPSCLQNATGL